MKTSLLDIFKVGIGPSSSHTVGPMLAAAHFAQLAPPGTARICACLYGSLALTGRGHATDRAVLLGLCGERPDTVDLDGMESRLAALPPGRFEVSFHGDEWMPEHPNGLRMRAYDGQGQLLLEQGYYSVGGGTIREEGAPATVQSTVVVPYPFSCADELLGLGEELGLAIWEIGLRNELAWHSQAEIEAWLQRIWRVMQESVRRGLSCEGILPGGLQVARRARNLARQLDPGDSLAPLDWVEAYAMAVNEENAAGGRVVTAPTNGSAGIIPAVAHYYQRFVKGADQAGLDRYFLTAAVLGTLYKENASISGADVGCQGEVGVACSMAAGGLVAAQGGSNRCLEKAAEIAMEHHLGLTCDPVGGLVQIPCIERNAMGATQAIHAARLAMHEGAGHKVSLDRAIRTMLMTGRDMQSTYKETSLAGLAVNVPLC
ncbi:L-serine ammonia-lyase [bacterium]|nr:L-serine ammonia-lyase [bacterium]